MLIWQFHLDWASSKTESQQGKENPEATERRRSKATKKGVIVTTNCWLLAQNSFDVYSWKKNYLNFHVSKHYFSFMAFSSIHIQTSWKQGFMPRPLVASIQHPELPSKYLSTIWKMLDNSSRSLNWIELNMRNLQIMVGGVASSILIFSEVSVFVELG